MADLIADVLANFTALADEWQSDAEALESYHSGAGKPILTCRAALLAAVQQAKADTDRLTVEQWASLHHATPTTVKRWIAAGQLDAEHTSSGYRIKRTAVGPNASARRQALSASASDAHSRRRARATPSPEHT